MKNSNILTESNISTFENVFIEKNLLKALNNTCLKTFNNPRNKDNDAITIVAPAKPSNAERLFIKENRWGKIGMTKYLVENVAYLAIYETSPVNAIRSFARITSIESYPDGYIVKVRPPVKLHCPIKEGKIKAPQNRNYYYLEGLLHAKTMDDLDGYMVPYECYCNNYKPSKEPR